MRTYRLPVNTELDVQLEIEFSVKRRRESALDAVDKLSLLVPEAFLEACRERAAKHIEELVEETDD